VQRDCREAVAMVARLAKRKCVTTCFSVMCYWWSRLKDHGRAWHVCVVALAVTSSGRSDQSSRRGSGRVRRGWRYCGPRPATSSRAATP
jgi:hypothetical protein